MARPTTTLLTRPLIVTTALGLIRRGERLTLPALAARLKVHPSSIYHHIPGGRAQIIDLMRAELYSGIDLEALRCPDTSWEQRLRQWAQDYRSASATIPELIPVVMAQAVDDRPTQALYEALFLLLAESGLPEPLWMDAAAMLDVIVLGSALDAASPVPLWQDVDPEFTLLSGPVAAQDTQERTLRGFRTAVDAALAWIGAHAQGASPDQVDDPAGEH